MWFKRGVFLDFFSVQGGPREGQKGLKKVKNGVFSSKWSNLAKNSDF